MADYAEITDATTEWKSAGALTENVIFQVKSGSVLLTTHSAPTGSMGLRLEAGDREMFYSGRTVRYRRIGSSPAVIARVAP